VVDAAKAMMRSPLYAAVEAHKIFTKNDGEIRQLGTLGTGNHFIEICLDENQDVWIMLHSGSRGIGNKIGSYFIQKAKEEMARYFISVPDRDLSYLVDGSDLFIDYWNALSWAQRYATQNRVLMMEAVKSTLSNMLPDFSVTEEAVNCHHNYCSLEKHFGHQVFLTRKGAVSAAKDQLGIIPSAMGQTSYIVKGKGNRDAFHSCSHGAGRVMSRGEAKKTITLEDHAIATAGVECRKDADVLDESPAAYKPIDAVMEAQKDLVDIVHKLKAVLTVKG
jgi:tRNA-splicing ligase RtcB